MSELALRLDKAERAADIGIGSKLDMRPIETQTRKCNRRGDICVFRELLGSLAGCPAKKNHTLVIVCFS